MNELQPTPSEDSGTSSDTRSPAKPLILSGPVLLWIVLPLPVVLLWEYARFSPLVAWVFLGLSALWVVLFLRTLVEYLVSGFDQWASQTGRELGRVYTITKSGR